MTEKGFCVGILSINPEELFLIKIISNLVCFAVLIFQCSISLT